MEIIVKNRIPFKYLKTLVQSYAESWDWEFDGLSKFNYYVGILYSLTDRQSKNHNFCCFAVENNKCVGHILAYVANKPKIIHPVIRFINNVCSLLLILNKQGRIAKRGYDLYLDFYEKAIGLGKLVIGGKQNQKKISEGFSVSVDKSCRNRGIYRKMNEALFDAVEGIFILHTETCSVYQAHEALGFKHLFEVPYPNGIEGYSWGKSNSFVMYGSKENLYVRV